MSELESVEKVRFGRSCYTCSSHSDMEQTLKLCVCIHDPLERTIFTTLSQTRKKERKKEKDIRSEGQIVNDSMSRSTEQNYSTENLLLMISSPSILESVKRSVSGYFRSLILLVIWYFLSFGTFGC